MVSIDHEWCDVWRTDKGWVTCDGYEDKTLRSGQKISDISRLTCGEAILEKVEFEFATCVQWKVADVCRNPAIAFNKLDYSIKNPLSQISTIGLVHLPLPSPAYGVYCSDE